MQNNKEEVDKSSPTTSGPDSDVASIEEEVADAKKEKRTKGSEEKTKEEKEKEEQFLSSKVTAGANYLGSMFSTAWNKTAKTASSFSFVSASTTEKDANATSTTAATEDVEKDEGTVAENQDQAQENSNASSFLSAAMSKVGFKAFGGGGGSNEVEEKTDGQTELEASATLVAAEKASFFSSAFSMVGKATSVIKEKVNSTAIISEFNKEQENFIKSKSMTNIENGINPWVGYRREEELKARILSLSEDKRNFLRAPPSGVVFEFDYTPQVSAVAMALLEEDPRLKAMRYELVPKKIKEDDFWRNYFYRVNLIQQSFELDMEITSSKSTKKEVKALKDDDDVENHPSQEDNEFVSESYVASSKELAEADESMKKLDLDLEADLEGELQEYEVVKDAEQNPEWENQIQEMLDAEEKK